MGVNSTASGYLAFCNKVTSQALGRKIETGKTLSCVRGTRFLAVFPGVLNHCNNKYEAPVSCFLFIEHFGNMVHVENCAAKRFANYSSETLQAMDCVYTRVDKSVDCISSACVEYGVNGAIPIFLFPYFLNLRLIFLYLVSFFSSPRNA
jgi:hypothetical protein